MIKQGAKYKCIYIGGGGSEYNEGEWVVETITPKTLVVEKTGEGGAFECYKKGDKIKCTNRSGNPLRDWEDGTFTIYPDQSGTPFYFYQ